MYTFIVNPKAGRGRSVKYIQQVQQYLDKQQIEYEILYSDYAGHSTVLAEGLKGQKRDAVVAVGGDGTVVEVARGMAGSALPLGIIPAGTGNDFSRTLKISRDPVEALKTILDGHITCSDMGLLNGDTYFLNVAGFGFDASVLKYSYKTNRIFRGMAAYFSAVFLALINLKFPRARIATPEGVIEKEILMLAVANGQCFGGGMMVAPDASLDDGLFDVCLVERVSRLHVLCILPSFIKGTHISNKHVHYFKCSDLSVTCEPENQLNIDGELGGYTPVTFKMLPRFLNIISPAVSGQKS